MDALLITCNARRTKAQLFTLSCADGDAVYSPGKIISEWIGRAKIWKLQHFRDVQRNGAFKFSSTFQTGKSWMQYSWLETAGFSLHCDFAFFFLCLIFSTIVYFLCVLKKWHRMLQTSCVAWSSELRINFPGRARESVLHACFCLLRHSFSLRCIQTGVSVLSGELMFILGSQVPTFPNRARLTWKSTDAFFIRLLRSLGTDPGLAQEKMVWGRCWHLYELSALLAMLYWIQSKLFQIFASLNR